MRWFFCIVIALLVAVFVCGDARAWSRSRDQDFNVCLWWKNRSVTYLVNETCSVDVPLNNCLNAVQAAFDAWNGHACSDFQFLYGGTTPRRDAGYDQSKSNNINLIVWLESDWETHDCPDPENEPVCRDWEAIALTTTTYDTYTGQIVDSDVEMNGDHFPFSTGASTQAMDIHNTLAHEAGHVLGLDHSRLTDATMWKEADEGEIEKRDLTQDDIDGLCFMYPQGQPTPDYYLSGGNQIICRLDPPNDNCGCHIGGPGGLLPLLLGTGLLGYRTKSNGRQKS